MDDAHLATVHIPDQEAVVIAGLVDYFAAIEAEITRRLAHTRLSSPLLSHGLLNGRQGHATRRLIGLVALLEVDLHVVTELEAGQLACLQVDVARVLEGAVGVLFEARLHETCDGLVCGVHVVLRVAVHAPGQLGLVAGHERGHGDERRGLGLNDLFVGEENVVEWRLLLEQQGQAIVIEDVGEANERHPVERVLFQVWHSMSIGCLGVHVNANRVSVCAAGAHPLEDHVDELVV